MHRLLSEKEITEYLLRIGFSDEIKNDPETLKALMTAHRLSVPFENLDVYHLGKEPELTADALFDKLIRRRRGGYCFELNGLFAKLLKSLGFDVSLCMARIVKGDFLSPPSHEVLIINIGEKRYFCDVGFGGPAPSCPIAITYDKSAFCTEGREYRFEKRGNETALCIFRDENFSDMMIFDETPRNEVDFVPLNAFCAYSPKEPFVHRSIAWLATLQGKISIDGRIFREEKNGNKEERELKTSEEVSHILKTKFGIEFDADKCNILRK